MNPLLTRGPAVALVLFVTLFSWWMLALQLDLTNQERTALGSRPSATPFVGHEGGVVAGPATPDSAGEAGPLVERGVEQEAEAAAEEAEGSARRERDSEEESDARGPSDASGIRDLEPSGSGPDESASTGACPSDGDLDSQMQRAASVGSGYTDRFSYTTGQTVRLFLSTCKADELRFHGMSCAPPVFTDAIYLVDLLSRRGTPFDDRANATEPQHLDIRESDLPQLPVSCFRVVRLERPLLIHNDKCASCLDCAFRTEVELSLRGVPPGVYRILFTVSTGPPSSSTFALNVPPSSINFLVKPTLEQLRSRGAAGFGQGPLAPPSQAPPQSAPVALMEQADDRGLPAVSPAADEAAPPSPERRDRGLVVFKFPVLTFVAYNQACGNNLYSVDGTRFVLTEAGWRRPQTYFSQRWQWNSLHHSIDPSVLLLRELMDVAARRQDSRPAPTPVRDLTRSRAAAASADDDFSLTALGIVALDDLDLEQQPELLAEASLLVLSVHDEYWTKGCYTLVRQWVKDGGRLLSVSGNTAWWLVTLTRNQSAIFLVKQPEHLNVTLRSLRQDPEFASWFTSSSDPGSGDGEGRSAIDDASVERLARRLTSEEDPLWTGQSQKSRRFRTSALLGLHFNFGGFDAWTRISGDNKKWGELLEGLRSSRVVEPTNAKGNNVSISSAGGFKVLDASHPIFQQLSLARNQWVGRSVMGVEIDGLPLLHNDKVYWQYVSKVDGPELEYDMESFRPLAAAFIFRNRLRYVTAVAEMWLKKGSGQRRGHVLVLGSVTWFRCISQQRLNGSMPRHILRNAFGYMMQGR